MMNEKEFRADLYKAYIASGFKYPILIQEYIEIAEAFVFRQEKLTKEAYEDLTEKLSKINN